MAWTLFLLGLVYVACFGFWVWIGLPAMPVLLFAGGVLAVHYLTAESAMLRGLGLRPLRLGPKQGRAADIAWSLAPWVLPLALADGLTSLSGSWSAVIWVTTLIGVIELVVFAVLLIRHSLRRPRPVAEVEEASDPWLLAVYEQALEKAGLTRPRLLVLNSPIPNAMAFGLSPKRGIVIVSRGLLDVGLSGNELEAVLAHELTHLINRDTRLMLMASTFSLLAGWLVLAAARMVGDGLRTADEAGWRDNEGSVEGGVGAALAAVIAFVAGVTWAVSFVIVRSLSRYREYAADRGSSLITGNPAALAQALQKIQARIDLASEDQLRPLYAVSAIMLCAAHSEPHTSPRERTRRWWQALQFAGNAAAFGLAMAIATGFAFLIGSWWDLLFGAVTALGLAAALLALPAAGGLYLWNRFVPDKDFGDALIELFSTHPTVAHRLEHLAALEPEAAPSPALGGS